MITTYKKMVYTGTVQGLKATSNVLIYKDAKHAKENIFH